tara:strand:+ start:16784 stop:19561 length:2778 start_codon:yes stop_codon:yes gene_type:complete
MSKFFSKFQISILYLITLCVFLFFVFFSIFKFHQIYRSVYIQENQSIEKFNFISTSIISSLEKNYNNFFTKKNLNLPEIRIYLKENDLDALFDNLPKSKNKWIKSYVLNINAELLNTKIKIRGDNPNNWLHAKKSFRIQFKKKDLINLNRTFDYVLPRDSSLVNTYMGYYIANKMNLLTPNVRFVNLFINDNLQGLYLEVERTKENFLRKRNLMPVNIYNGSPSRTNSPLSLHNDLFINSHLWEKQSTFNRLDKNNKDDIDGFLTQLIKSINSEYEFNKLIQISKIDEWAKYSAYETIMQSWHSYENNNMRVVFDNWKGEIIPIAYDSILNDARNKLIINQEILYDNAPHLLFDTLLRSSEFNTKKYLIIKKFIEDGGFKLIKNEIDAVYELIKESWYADPNHYQFVVINNFDSNLFFNKSMDDEILKLKKRIDFIETKLKEIIYAENQLEWSYEKNNINFFTSSIVPIASVNICYKNEFNNDQINSLNNIDFYNFNKFNNLNCYKKDINFVSDRLKNKLNLSKPTHFIASDGYEIINTSFNKIFSSIKKPDYVFYKTSNNDIYQLAKYFSVYEKKYFKANIINKPINSNKDLHKNYIIFKDNNFINNDLVINNPVLIKPGTKFILDNKVSIIFKNKVIMLGKKDKKISFIGKTKNTKWGTISIEGKDSFLKNINLSGGFGGVVDNKFYTSMLSVRNTENVILENIKFLQNNVDKIPIYYDDLLHVIYSSNVKIKNSQFYNSIGDALDIDVSDVIISNCYFEHSGNDSIDFMSSRAKIENTNIFHSGDKGISVGENSKISIIKSSITKSFIGVESKDNSLVKMTNSSLINNNISLHGYNKNWRYGKEGGNFDIENSKFISNTNKSILLSNIINANDEKIHKDVEDFSTNKNVFISKNNSKILIRNSIIHNDFIYLGKDKNFEIFN